MTTIDSNVLKTLTSDSLNKINMGNKRTHSFKVDFTDEVEGFEGVFEVHYPSQLERLDMGVLKSRLLGGNFEVAVATDNIAHVISTLDVVLDTSPEWFKVDNPDLTYEMMEAIYVEYDEWVSSFRSSARKNTNSGDSKE